MLDRQRDPAPQVRFDSAAVRRAAPLPAPAHSPAMGCSCALSSRDSQRLSGNHWRKESHDVFNGSLSSRRSAEGMIGSRDLNVLKSPLGRLKRDRKLHWHVLRNDSICRGMDEQRLPIVCGSILCRLKLLQAWHILL